jgi:hypothetical protein
MLVDLSRKIMVNIEIQLDELFLIFKHLIVAMALWIRENLDEGSM